MYKILIHIITQSRDKWFYYQEDGADYVSDSLEAMKDTVLKLVEIYGEDDVKIVDQVTGDGPDGTELYIYDATDNYEELENRPYINDVEIIGRLSLQDLGIQPEGDYATNGRVDEVYDELTTNINNLETEINQNITNVNDKVGNLEDLYTVEQDTVVDAINETYDMINMLASKDQTITGLQTFSVLPESHVTPVQSTQFTNKAYVDAAIDNIDYSGFYTTDETKQLVQYYKMPLSVYNASATPTEAEMADLQTIVDYYLENGRIPAILFYDMAAPGYTYIIWGVPGISELNPNVTRLTWNGAAYYTHSTGEEDYIEVGRQSWYITYNVNTGKITTTRLQKSGEFKDGFKLSSDSDLKAYIDEAIAAIPEVDLTPYATTEYVDNAIDAIPEVDLTPYATIEYVDGAIPEPSFYVINLTNDDNSDLYYLNSTYCPSGVSYLSTEATAKFCEYINKHFTEDHRVSKPLIITYENTYYLIVDKFVNGTEGSGGATWATFTFKCTGIVRESSNYSTESTGILKNVVFGIRLSLPDEDGKYNVLENRQSYFSTELHQGYLSTQNTKSYTPKKDYHPATKKYVDDSIVSAIGDIVSFGVELVDELPTENISTSTVYMVPSTKTEEQNVKDEYLYTGTDWELIGTTKVDLSNYYNKQEVDELVDEAKNNIDAATVYVDEQIANTRTYVDEQTIATRSYIDEQAILANAYTDERINSLYLICNEDEYNAMSQQERDSYLIAVVDPMAELTEQSTMNLTNILNDGTTDIEIDMGENAAIAVTEQIIGGTQ